MITEILNEIKVKNPKSIQFIPTKNDINNMTSFVTRRDYKRIMYLYGMDFLLSLKHYYIAKEQYEECEAINLVIEDNLPLDKSGSISALIMSN